MAPIPRKTYPELTALTAPVVDGDVLAAYRSPGPLRRLTASTFADYIKAFFSPSSGSALVGWIQSGTGAVLRLVQDKLREQPVTPADYGATGSNVAADTAAAQKAMLHKRVRFNQSMTVSSSLSFLSGQEVTIDAGVVVAMQAATNLPVFDGNAVDNVSISGGTVQACGTLSTETDGNGIRFRTSGRGNSVTGVTVTGHKGWGVLIADQENAKVHGCAFFDSPATDSDTNATTKGDIGILGSASNVSVLGNVCESGNAIAVGAFTQTSGDIIDGLIIAANAIKGYRQYGITCYKNDPAHSFIDTVITGNTVCDISGATAFSADGTFPFGCAIYVQGVEDAVVSSNTTARTHTAVVSFSSNLTPAAIGATNNTRILICDNTCTDDAMHGIEVSEPNNQGAAIGACAIRGNIVTSMGDVGIYVVQRANVDVDLNLVDTTGGQGIFVDNSTTKRANVNVRSNTVRNVTLAGISVNFVQNSSVFGNRVYGNANYPIIINNADNFDMSFNQVITTAGLAIVVDTACANFTYNGNSVEGTGTSVAHYMDSRPLSPSGNVQTGCTNTWGGTYAIGRAAAPASGTWAVGDQTYNVAPGPAGYAGWICTTAGTPGTHKGVGLIEP